MMGWKNTWRCAAAVVLVAASESAAVAADFVTPAETPSTFRRDLLPLDVEMIASLSKALTQAVRGIDSKTAVNRRSAAQLLALAVALDPGNRKARERLADFNRNRHRPDLGDNEQAFLIQQIDSVITGLDFPEAGDAGRALAAYLKDVVRFLDPAAQDSDSPEPVAELGNWEGWVPGLPAYEEKIPTEVPAQPPEPEAPEQEFLLAQAEVTTPIWKKVSFGETEKWELSPGTLKMLADKLTPPLGEPDTFSIIGRGPAASLSARTAQTIFFQLLRNEGTTLPKHGNIMIGSGLEDALLVSENRSTISAAAAVLASAALTGRVPNATILGTVDAKGAYELPRGAWEQLRCLGPGNGGRLVLPAAIATTDLPAILTLENPKFFFDYEVVLAANFHELLELSAKEPGEALTKASSLFQQIREKIGSQPIGQYVANPFVRRRLGEVFQLAPYHASVKMLGIQGSGNRPIHLTRVIFALELRHALEPLNWLLVRTEPFLAVKEYQKILTSHEACAEAIEELSRYADRGEEDLLTKLKELMSEVKSLERATRARGDEYEAAVAINVAHISLIQSASAFKDLLASACSDTPVAPAPPAPPVSTSQEN
jgi:hypothetical protein